MYLREFLLKFNNPITQYNTRQINTKVRITDRSLENGTRYVQSYYLNRNLHIHLIGTKVDDLR